LQCYHPIPAWRQPGRTENGKQRISFSPDNAIEKISVPCGQCIGCRLRKSVDWAFRCEHELSLHKLNTFITLTYDDKHLKNPSLPTKEERAEGKTDYQRFLKSFRKLIYPLKIRFFLCGEYGETTWRKHYHAIIFGYDFMDKKQIQTGDVSQPYYISETLGELWPHGNHLIADANFETAAYISRYITKKINGEKAENHYNRVFTDWNEITGEITYFEEVQLEPEFITMSKRPAIGTGWFEKYQDDCYPSNYLVKDGHKYPVPKFYDVLLERKDPELLESVKLERKMRAFENLADNYPERRAAKELCKISTTKSLGRNKV
jgi:hypothetical protein